MPDEPEALPWAATSPPTFDALYGLEYLSWDDQELRARVRVTDEILGPGGTVHGGIFASMAESLASVGTAMAVQSADGAGVVCMSINTVTYSAIEHGEIRALARCDHRRSTQAVWDIWITDSDSRPVAHSTATVAIRPGLSQAP